MASAVQPVPAATCTPDIVGNAFVHQYYLILHQSPELVHRFYQDISKLGRPEENGVMDITTTMQTINEKILSLDYGEFSAEISTVDAQESYNGGVLVLVTGFLTGKDNVTRKFTQSFFLAPQDKGYFVLNDMFRYVDGPNNPNENECSANDVEAPVTPEQDPSPVQENHISEQPAEFSEEVNGEEVYNPSENGDGSIIEEEVPVSEVVDEALDDSPMVVESSSKVEEVPKKSYASILKVMKETAAPLSTASFPPKSVAKSQEQQTTVASTPVPVSDTPVSSTAAAMENGNNQDGEAEGPSIYVKGLPPNATPALLENEFKKFGPIRNGGIQVRSQKGFCFGFVEFEVASAVQSAIEASPIMIGGRRAVVEEKRSTSRGNHRGRPSSGAGAGYRNEGPRGRGNFGGGRGYNRGDFGNRNDYGNRNSNRGGFLNRGGGYQRVDNGGPMNRSSEVTVNAAARSVAPQVSAPA